MNKRLIMVQHQDGRREYICKKCGNRMIHDDNTTSHFSQGEYSESGGERLVCPECGMTSDYPKMRVSDFRHQEVSF